LESNDPSVAKYQFRLNIGSSASKLDFGLNSHLKDLKKTGQFNEWVRTALRTQFLLESLLVNGNKDEVLEHLSNLSPNSPLNALTNKKVSTHA
jgi:hypothetical protein